MVRVMDLQKVPSLQSDHGLQEVRWVRADHSYHPYQKIQQIQMGPADRIKRNLKCQSP